MNNSVLEQVQQICSGYQNDPTRMMDIVRAVQGRFGSVSREAAELIASAVSIEPVEVESVVSFYSFLSTEKKGEIVIRLCNDVVDRLQGADEVGLALQAELGVAFSETTEDGRFTLEHTPCIGMSDQAPAALVNDVVVTRLTPDSARAMVRELKEHGSPAQLVKQFGDGNNSDQLVQAMVSNNLREAGKVIFGEHAAESGLANAVGMSPSEVIRAVKNARLRGRGGAGFPTGMKWEFTRGAVGDEKVVICNADEGEPGTFKDRVILTERPELLFEGMTIAGYAIGAKVGIVYLRGEYSYLQGLLEDCLQKRREQGLLGENIKGKEGFSFDIRIQMGAGAYICGEETALISSCEGLRGDPKNRPPFPAQKGYLGRPTAVNNVETLCCAARILAEGAGWFSSIGNGKSVGTKLLSVSGDCKRPGVYELPFGVTLEELIKKVQASDTAAVQVGGPSGVMVGEGDFGREICFDDLATGGSIMIFNSKRNVLKIAAEFMEFFVEESCGYCTPCRVGNVLIKECLDRIIAGKGEACDLEYLKNLGAAIKSASRCGLGQTSPNPVLSTLEHFRSAYEVALTYDSDGFQPGFDLKKAVAKAEGIIGRKSVHC